MTHPQHPPRAVLEQALEANGCERIKEFYAVGPVQRAAVESFAQALAHQTPSTAGEAEILSFDNCRAERMCRSWCGNGACESHHGISPQVEPAPNQEQALQRLSELWQELQPEEFDAAPRPILSSEALRQLDEVIPFRINLVKSGQMASLSVLHECINNVAEEFDLPDHMKPMCIREPAPSTLGMKIIVDESLPADELRIVQNGKTVGTITNIAAPSMAGEQYLRDAQEAPFEAWWESMGQYGRAGGSGYEKTFAWNAWCAALLQSTAPPVEPCPVCGGSGERTYMECRGPDTYDVTAGCDVCDGSGTLEHAYEKALKHRDDLAAQLQAIRMKQYLGAAMPVGERTGQHTNVEKSTHRRYATERERLQALAETAQQGREVEKIINEAVKRNPQAFVFKGEKK